MRWAMLNFDFGNPFFFFFFKYLLPWYSVTFFYNQWSHLVKNNLGNFNLGNLGN